MSAATFRLREAASPLPANLGRPGGGYEGPPLMEAHIAVDGQNRRPKAPSPAGLLIPSLHGHPFDLLTSAPLREFAQALNS